jgi:agmatinase
MGNLIIGPREFRRIGVRGVLAQILDNRRYYVTIDVDGFDACLAPGSGSPSIGGLDYYEVTDLSRGIAQKGEVVGFDFVEVAPQYDPTEVTAQLAAA